MLCDEDPGPRCLHLGVQLGPDRIEAVEQRFEPGRHGLAKIARKWMFVEALDWPNRRDVLTAAPISLGPVTASKSEPVSNAAVLVN